MDMSKDGMFLINIPNEKRNTNKKTNDHFLYRKMVQKISPRNVPKLKK